MRRDELDDLISEKLPDSYGGMVNLNSPTQLAKLLFDDLGLPVIEKLRVERTLQVSLRYLDL